MSAAEYWGLGLSLFFYVASFAAACIPGRKGLMVLMLVSGLLSQLISASLRWSDIGHPPIFGTYEAALAASWFLLLFVALSYRSVHGHFGLLVKTSVPMAVAIIVYGLTFNTEHYCPLFKCID